MNAREALETIKGAMPHGWHNDMLNAGQWSRALRILEAGAASLDARVALAVCRGQTYGEAPQLTEDDLEVDDDVKFDTYLATLAPGAQETKHAAE